METLVKGDVVDIIAPASSCSREEFDAAIGYIQSLGLTPRYDINLLKSQKFLSNTDEFRANDFMRAVSATDSKLVWCLRGGYGSLRLLNRISRYKKPKHKKIFIGLSDISILHQFIIDRWGWKALHAPVLCRMGSKSCSTKEKAAFKKILLKEAKEELVFASLRPLNKAASAKKSVKGKVIGGNLCSLCSMQGSKFQWSAKSKILFLEDVSERGYAVDRMLTQLELSGALKGVKAIIFGDFTGGLEPDGKNLVSYSLKKFAETIKVPVFSGLKSGHGKIQMPLLLNSSSVLQCGKSGLLKVKY